MISRSRAALTGLIALCCALFIALLMSTVPVPAAPGDTRSIDPDAVTSIEIHKFEQPVVAGSVANGLPMDTSGLTPVPGATYTAKRVPGIDLTTNSGQRAAAGLTLREVAERTDGVPAEASAVTDGNGRATLSGLGVGLYYVQETVIPAGYAGASPFVVALPLTHPTERDSWLTTVHVYPKTSRVGVDLEVVDQDAVKIGDTVRWISRSGIPLRSSITGYRVDQIIHPELALTGGTGNGTSSVRVTIEAGGEVQAQAQMRFVSFVRQVADTPSLMANVDYRTSYSATTRTLQVLFLEPGLRKLEQAIAGSPGARVRIEYDTTVRGEGALLNEAVLYPSRYDLDTGTGIRDGAVTKWGSLLVTVMQNDDPSRPVAGAIFELYATPQDAFARRNPITINGVSRWGTDDQGRLLINGLRFSEFVNGLDRETSDPLFRDYWVVPVSLPDGWSWVDQQPLSGTVNSDLEYQTLVYLAEQEPGGSDPKRAGVILGWISGLLTFDWFGGSSGSSSGGSSPTTPDGQPGAQSEVRSEGQPGVQSGTQPGTAPDTSAGRDDLASTGAQVIGFVIFGLVLIIAGTFLVLDRRRRNEEAES